MERSPSNDSQIDDRSPRKNVHNTEDQSRVEINEAIMKSINEVRLPEINRGISDSSYGISEEDQLLNEAIFKSLQDR